MLGTVIEIHYMDFGPAGKESYDSHTQAAMKLMVAWSCCNPQHWVAKHAKTV